jgi:predicted amidohydrolase
VILGALAWPVEATPSVAAYAEKLDRWIAEAAGAELLLMPEYACVELGAALAGQSVATEAEELRAMVAHADEVLAAMRDAARRHRVWLQPGTLPMARGNEVVNRAPLIRPDGAVAFQDKSKMTRFEAERWGVSAGNPPSVFDTDWGRIGIAICYDAEFPKLVRAQVEAGAWCVLVPTCTDSLHGYNRVRFSAQARAVENQVYMAVAPTIGLAPHSTALDENHGAASIHGPVDRGFPADGVIVQGGLDQPGWVQARLDRAAIARVREEGAVRNHRDWPTAPVPPPLPASYT